MKPLSLHFVPLLLAALLLAAGCQKSTAPGAVPLPGDPLELYRLGATALERGEVARSVEFLQSAVQREPSFQEAQFLLGVAAHRAGKTGVAVRAFADTLLLAPRLPLRPYSLADVHYNLAVLFEGTGREDAAVEQLRRAVAQDPDFARAWLELASLERRLGQRDAALAHVEQALRADPGLAQAHRVRAQLARETADLELAERALRSAVLYASGPAEVHLELARLLLERGQPAEALGALEPYLSARPADATARQLRAEILRALGLERSAAADVASPAVDPS